MVIIDATDGSVIDILELSQSLGTYLSYGDMDDVTEADDEYEEDTSEEDASEEDTSEDASEQDAWEEDTSEGDI